MADPNKIDSQVVKNAMTRLCSDFTPLVAPLGFSRTNSRSRYWERQVDQLIHVIHFHRSGSSYGKPISYGVDIRVEFWLNNADGTRFNAAWLDSDHLRNSEGRAYHLRFRAETWSMYDRCLEDLMRVMREHALPWFEGQGT